MTTEQDILAAKTIENLRSILVLLRDAAHAMETAGAWGIAEEIRGLSPQVDDQIRAVVAWEDHYP